MIVRLFVVNKFYSTTLKIISRVVYLTQPVHCLTTITTISISFHLRHYCFRSSRIDRGEFQSVPHQVFEFITDTVVKWSEQVWRSRYYCWPSTLFRSPVESWPSQSAIQHQVKLFCATDTPDATVQLNSGSTECSVNSALCAFNCQKDLNCVEFNYRSTTQTCDMFYSLPSNYQKQSGCTHFQVTLMTETWN